MRTPFPRWSLPVCRPASSWGLRRIHNSRGIAHLGPPSPRLALRPHPPYTECRVVRSVDRSKRSQPSSGYMVECSEGEPGYIITRGAHVMSGYVGDDAATAAAIDEDGW